MICTTELEKSANQPAPRCQTPDTLRSYALLPRCQAHSRRLGCLDWSIPAARILRKIANLNPFPP